MRKKRSKNFFSSFVLENNQAKNEYFVEKEIKAGILLKGWEVRSFREKNISIEGSYVTIRNGEAYVFGTNFQSKLNYSNNSCYPSNRERKLLLRRKEIDFLSRKIDRKGYTIVVLSILLEKFWIKMIIGIAKGKKKYDKRMTIKKKEWKIKKEKFLKTVNRTSL